MTSLLQQEKIRWAGCAENQATEAEKRCHVSIENEDLPSLEYLTVLRIGLFDEERDDLTKWEAAFNQDGFLPPLSLRNEQLVMQELQNHARRVLDGYPSTLKGDKNRLETQEAKENINLTHALKLLIEEKTILHSLIESTEYVKELLMLDLGEAGEKIVAAEGPEHLQDYLHIELLPLLRHLEAVEKRQSEDTEDKIHEEL